MEGRALQCAECRGGFILPEAEESFLRRVSPRIAGRIEALPVPDLCPGCREQRRLGFRNEWHMYRRRCDVTGKDVISIYDGGSPCQILDPSYWWSDAFDPFEYGRDIDFSRPVFEQLHELHLAVPKAAIQNAKSDNSLYTNYSAENKNCYLCAGSGGNEDCYYCSRVFNSKFVADSYDILNSESCYGCTHCSGLYGCVFSKNCHNSSSLRYCENCRGCRDCIGCADLTNKSWCIFNEECTEREYRERAATLVSRADEVLRRKAVTTRSIYNFNCEDCTGDQLLNCSRCSSCYAVKESQDCRYLGSATYDRDCCDCNFMDQSELMYFTTNARNDYHVMFGALIWYSSDVLYSLNCFYSRNLFGCSGMKRGEHCILNKPYDASRYEYLLQRLVAHMRETGEWGRYFPLSMSPFPYNCSVAHEYYPMPREEVLERRCRWYETEASDERSKRSAPAGAACCSVTGRSFKITDQERELCSRLDVPLPAQCPDARRSARMSEIKQAIAYYV